MATTFEPKTDLEVGGMSLKAAWQKGDLPALVEASNRAMENDSVYRMSDFPPYKSPEVFKLGMGTLDDHYRIRPGDFTVVTGIPSHGKSTFINEVACRMAEKHGWTACFASFEQMPQVDHRRALRTYYNGKLEVQQSPEEKDQAKLVVIDPWNEMDHIRPKDMSLTEYTGYAIKAFRRLARVHRVHVIVA